VNESAETPLVCERRDKRSGGEELGEVEGGLIKKRRRISWIDEAARHDDEAAAVVSSIAATATTDESSEASQCSKCNVPTASR